MDNTEENKHLEAYRELRAGLIVGLPLLLFVVIFVAIGLPGLGAFIHLPSMMIAGGGTMAILFLGHGVSATFRGLFVMVTGRLVSEEEGDLALLCARLGLAGAVISGCLGSTIGIINMLKAGMDDVNMLSFGMAVSLLMIFYGLCLAAFFVIGESRIARAMKDVRGEASPAAKTVGRKRVFWLLAAVVVGFYLVFHLVYLIDIIS